ncbi:MAG: carbamate kinase [Bacteroidales bacterium]|nr:carbamate kinase [Bacteroidales bacterium]
MKTHTNKLAMVAFGGNALLRAGEKGTFQEQLANVERTCAQLCHLVSRGYDIVIGHGNGPQVGNGLLRHEAGKKLFGLEAMPMDFCGAETQGSIAYLIETALERVLRQAQDPRPVVSLVTRVEVAADDPGFRNPTKPVGPYYTEPGNDGATYRADPAGRGWRKVVASPKPIRILNIDLVERLAREGYIVVTVGGGGIPVVRDAEGLRGVEGVIDKDLASALAAVTMKADEFYILTDVPKVYLNFHTPEQRALDTMTIAQARQYLAEGMFTEGSMAPKVRAGIYFVENGGGACVITEASELGNPSCGTRIIP